MRQLICALALLPLASVASPPPVVPASIELHVVQTLALGGTGGGDYPTVDGAHHRLYLSRSDRVLVVDTASGKAVGEIAHTDGVHGVALAPRHGVGFASNGKANSVTVFASTTCGRWARSALQAAGRTRSCMTA